MDQKDQLAQLQERLGHTFADPSLCALAVTHRSWCAEHAGHEPNERLEFLGDAVLGLVVTADIYERFAVAEGELAKLRASVVSAAALADVAADLRVGDALLLGKGEDATGGRAKPSILADALEALFGAVFVDGGIDAARTTILRHLRSRIDDAAEGPGGRDYKTQLQELVAQGHDEPPDYELHGEGPDHEKHFTAVVRIGGDVLGRGEGRSKKQAEQAAAKVAWEALTGAPGDDETEVPPVPGRTEEKVAHA